MEGRGFYFSCQTPGTNFAAISFARQTKTLSLSLEKARWTDWVK